MSFWIVVLAVLMLGTAGLFWAWQRWSWRAAPVNAPRLTGRLVLPREARFGVAEAMAWFTALTPLLAKDGSHLVIEWRGEKQQVALQLSLPPTLEAVLRAQLLAWFPGARLELVGAAKANGALAVLPLRLTKPDLYPLRVPAEKEADPLLGVFGALTQHPESGGVRLMLGSAPADWRQWAPAALQTVERGMSLPPRGAWFWLWSLAQAIREAGWPPLPHRKAGLPPAALASTAEKVRQPVLSARLSVWAAGPTEEAARRHAEALAAQLATGFRSPFGNALVAACPPQRVAAIEAAEALPSPVVALGAAELAALFHLPAAEHPLLPREASRRVALPAALRHTGESEENPISRLGEALTPEGPVPFGLGLIERRQHLYIIGKTGAGKSTLLATLLADDLTSGRSVGLLDPHGDLAELALALVPPERADQLCYFNPADADYPVGFNLLAATTPAERPLVTSSVVSVFKKLYSDSWGPRLENTLRHALLVLLETPTPSLVALPRLLTDRRYRQRLMEHVRDPLLRTFFLEEFETYDPRWRAEAVSPILNKVEQFLASPTIRHVVGQSRGGINLRQFMDAGGILIANLATGRLGEDNAALLGGLLVAGFQLAAMGRANQPEEQRLDFFLHIDEFPHFATEAFAGILSQARKYRLGLTLSHQYLGQLPPGMLEAVLGNAASLCVFRVGGPDAVHLARELGPTFDAQDLVHLPDHQFCVRLNREGAMLPPFSARTVPVAAPAREVAPLIDGSRRRWARPRAEVELEIADQWEGRAD